MMREEPRNAGASATTEWDIATRLFHWLLVALLAFSWWSGERHEMEWHRYSGYGILSLLIFRIYWGFAGSRSARFGAFLRGPSAVKTYVTALARGTAPASAGHNPLGGWSVVAMLAALAAMVTAGLFSVDVDGFESGPLADLVSFDQGRSAAELHETIFSGLLALIGLHILAVLFYLLFFRRNLIRPMISGRAGGGNISGRSLLHRFAAGIIIAAMLSWAIINAAQLIA